MIIDCVSDLHGYYPELPGGDLLIVAGDLTARDTVKQMKEFHQWLSNQEYDCKVYIAGNHDGQLRSGMPTNQKELDDHLNVLLNLSQEYLIEDCNIYYLQDAGFTCGDGFKIWGAPWTPTFCNWHFMLPPEERKAKWDLIPEDTDILIVHGPAWSILDECPDMDGNMEHAGCMHLYNRLQVIKPKLFVCGHIHEGYGKVLLKHNGPNTLCVNASIMNGDYKPLNQPIRIEL